MKKIFLIILLFLIASLGAYAFASDNTSAIAQNSNMVKQLSQVHGEVLQYDQVINLSKDILASTEQYDNQTLAKLYLLLAHTASNKSDINSSLNYAQLGLSHSPKGEAELGLLLKLSNAHMAKKQFDKLLNSAERAISASQLNNQSMLLSLSYRSVAFAMLGDYGRTLTDLQQVESMIEQKDLSPTYIELFSTLATAYYYLGDYQTALTMQLKVLKLRYELNQKENIDQTYLYIGYAYLFLQRYDDAYNSFWESKKHARLKSAPISAAFASKGLAISLLKQQQFSKVISELENSVTVFEQHDLEDDYLESLVALASAHINRSEHSVAYHYLLKIQQLLSGETMSLQYLGYYRMMADMYFMDADYQQAYFYAKKLSQLLQIKVNKKKKEVNYTHDFYNKSEAKLDEINSLTQTKELAIKLAENSELAYVYQDKYQQQRNIIMLLGITVVLLVCFFVLFILKQRARKTEATYKQVENKKEVITSPQLTKQNYQLVYVKSRKFQYPVTIGYISIENWNELQFSFTKRVVEEVRLTIEKVISEQLTEFEYAGVLNSGEYLLIYEHLNERETQLKFQKLTQELNALFFANLGTFSVMINHQLASPSFKDIDPFSFLAKLTNSEEADTTTKLKVLQ